MLCFGRRLNPGTDVESTLGLFHILQWQLCTSVSFVWHHQNSLFHFLTKLEVTTNLCVYMQKTYSFYKFCHYLLVKYTGLLCLVGSFLKSNNMFSKVVEEIHYFHIFGRDMLTVEILHLKYSQACILKEYCRLSALT